MGSKERFRIINVVGLSAIGTATVACSSGSSGPPLLDGGQGSGGGCVSVAVASADSGFTLKPAPCVDQGSLQPGQLLLTASGELLALDGYTFPDPNGTFADGWRVNFTHYIATFDKVSMWTDPDMVPTDQSQHGPLVAELDGPWAVDMHLNGTAFPYVDGKEQGERAVAFAVIPTRTGTATSHSRWTERASPLASAPSCPHRVPST